MSLGSDQQERSWDGMKIFHRVSPEVRTTIRAESRFMKDEAVLVTVVHQFMNRVGNIINMAASWSIVDIGLHDAIQGDRLGRNA